MKNISGEIDFVILWVDGSDPEWQAEKRKYSADSHADDSSERYRDWDNLRYWFRGVEKFAPWVRKIHFVTWGHLPEWLDKDHPKLNIVKHTDFIPEKYLPTFSSHTIELNIHRIKDLSDNFVYFNDDVFITAPVSEGDFFKNGLPRDCAVLNVHCYSKSMPVQMTAINDTGIINEHFNIKEAIKGSPFKWLNPLYGKHLLRTLPLMFCPRFPGFYQPHLHSSLLKPTFDEIWEKEYDILDKTCMNKFRTCYDVNQWVFREWQLASGKFIPCSPFKGHAYFGDRDGKDIFLKAAEDIKKKKYKIISINDCAMSDSEFIRYRDAVNSAFHTILSERSAFEK